MPYFISVVIPAHNRNDSLEETIKSLLNQDYLKNSYEIIIVGCNKNRTREVIAALHNRLIKFYEIDSTYPDKKRNFGINIAKGEIIAFTDDDCLPNKDWLSKINAAFESEKDLAGIEGKTIQDNKQIFCHASENLFGGKYLACNYAFKKDILIKVNGFDENYGFFREDTDLVFKVLNLGNKVKFDEQVIVYHPARKISKFTKIKELFLVKGDIRLFKKFPDLYTKHFGLICKGAFKQSFFSWFVFSVSLYLSFSSNVLFLIMGLAFLAIFRYLVELREKQFNLLELVILFFSCLLRDLLFPFFFTYYYLIIHPKKS